MSEVGQLLRLARGGRSKYLVEGEVRVNHGSLTRIESGRRLPEARTVVKLCAYYGANPRPLLAALNRDRYRRDLALIREEDQLTDDDRHLLAYGGHR